MTLYDNVYLLILGVIWQPGWKTIKCAGNFPLPLAQQSVIRALDFIYSLFRSLPEVWPQNQSICLQANCSKCNCIIVFFSCRAYGIWFFACFFLISNYMFVTVHCSCSSVTPTHLSRSSSVGLSPRIQNHLRFPVTFI